MTVARIQPTQLPIPAYLARQADPAFAGAALTRICGPTGTPIPIGGAWATDSRLHYSKDQPWDDGGNFVLLEQKSTEPTKLILDAHSWTPVIGSRNTTPVSPLLHACYECRWRPGHPGELVGWLKSTQELIIFDPLTDRVSWRVKIPGDPSLGWLSEGTISDDGRWTCFATSMASPQLSGAKDYVQVIDLDQRRVGPPCDVTAFTKGVTDNTAHGLLGNVNISTRGNFIYCKMEGTPEYGFILAVDKPTLIATPQTMATDGLRMFQVQGNRAGWAACMSHADMNELPGGAECVIGGVRDFEDSNFGPLASEYKKRNGSVVAIDCATGRATFIGPGTDHTGGPRVAGDQHTSGRAYKLRQQGKPAHLVTYASVRESGGQLVLADEIVLLSTDGLRTLTRFGVTRTDDSSYRGEAHSCPSPDGRSVIWASNWQSNTSAPGPSLADVKSYCVSMAAVVVPPPPPVQERFYIDPAWTYAPEGGIIDRATGRLVPLREVAKLLNGIKA